MSASDSTEHERWSDDAAAYVLHALNAAEVERFEAHLRECAGCRDEVTRLRVVSDALPAAAPPMAAPPELKHRIMTTVRAEAELLRSAGPGTDRARTRGRRPPARWRGWSGMTLSLAAAAAGLIAVGVAVGGLAFGGGGGQSARTASAQIDAVALPGARVSVRRAGGSTALAVAGLPAPPPGHIWQIWIKRPGLPPQRSARFELRNGVVDVPGDLRGANLLMVTAESALHFSDTPTGPVLIRARLA